MGGWGSGGHNRRNTSVRECAKIWISQVQAWARDNGLDMWDLVGNPLRLRVNRGGQSWSVTLRLTWGPCGKDGCNTRFYLVCPVCGYRGMVLYLPHSARAGRLFACRRCWRLAYPTQQERIPRLAGLVGLPSGGAFDPRRMGSTWGAGPDDYRDRYVNVFGLVGE